MSIDVVYGDPELAYYCYHWRVDCNPCTKSKCPSGALPWFEQDIGLIQNVHGKLYITGLEKKEEKNIMKYNIGDTINFSNEYGEVCEGEIVGVGSDKYTGSDSGSVDVILEDGIFSYWSKKTDKYVPVKEKSIDSLFLEVKDSKKCINFISPKEIIL